MARVDQRLARRRGLLVWTLFGLAGASCVVGACGGETAPAQPKGWKDEIELASPVDLNPDPHILEIELTASLTDLSFTSGGTTAAWTYNGTVPGPLLEMTRGDRLIVHFTNDLPEPTTIHWHGVRVPAEMDGMPGHSQDEVPPGGTFDYDFVVPDAGLFWYHPHENAAAQVGFGMYGAIWVHPAPGDEEPDQGELGDELVLVLSDISIDSAGTLEDPAAGGDLGTVFGREGAMILVNGRPHPSLDVRSGLRQRWHLVNAARSRYFQLSLPGHRFTQIGSDGGLMNAAEEKDLLLLLPGQRADVLVTPKGEPDAEVGLTWTPYERGPDTAGQQQLPQEVMRLFFDSSDPEGDKAIVAPEPYHAKRVIETIDTNGATPIPLQLTLAKNDEGHPELGFNGVVYDDAQPLQATVGETQVWSIENTTDWDHPFHLHGFFFQPLDADGAPIEPRGWYDTIDVPTGMTSRFAVKYDNRPGMWMFHCHILDHEGAGMMGMLDLLRP